MFKESLFNSDKYQYTMSKVHFNTGKYNERAIFNYFFRKAPDNNGWSIVSGVSEVLDLINIMNNDLYSYQDKYEMFSKLFNSEVDKEYIEKLCNLKFTGNIYSMKEGEIVFPNEPIIIIDAPLIEAQILETPILSIMNHQCNIATKASRVVRASKDIPVSSFGSRRAHGPWASIYGDKAAFIGGCSSVSNIMTDNLFDIPCTGTMAHSFIESYLPAGKEGEYKAFYDFVKYNDGTNILLIDTYSVLKSGLPNAIKVFKEFDLENRFKKTGQTYGIRLDSGDLAYLSKQCRKELNKAGFKHAIISATNGLDEYLIKDLLDQEAEINLFGVGDAIATSKHNPCFGGVYKLSQINGTPTIKLSEDTIKVINPGFQQVYRIYENNEAKADLICLRENDRNVEQLISNQDITISAEFDKRKTTTFKSNNYKYKELLITVVENGKIIYTCDSIEAANYCKVSLSSFSQEHKRLVNPHIYKVDISDNLYDLKMETINNIEKSL